MSLHPARHLREHFFTPHPATAAIKTTLTAGRLSNYLNIKNEFVSEVIQASSVLLLLFPSPTKNINS